MADFVKGDTNTIVITCLNRDGSLFNLLNCTVKLKYRIGSTVYPIINMVILDPPEDSQASYEFQAGELANEGIMYAEVEITSDIIRVLSSAEVMEFTVRGKTIT